MKKALNIFFVANCILILLFIPLLIIVAAINPSKKEPPMFINYIAIVLIINFVLIGFSYLLANFKELKKTIREFINEK